MLKLRLMSCVALLLCFATVAVAQDDAKKGKDKKKARAAGSANSYIMKAFKSVEMTDEQKKKAEAVLAKYDGEMKDARKAVVSVLSKDENKAKNEARKEAAKAGLKGKEMTEAVEKAMGLSEDKMAKYREALKKPAAVTKKVKDEIMALLTDDQKAKMPAPKKAKAREKARRSQRETATFRLFLSSYRT
ncbi:hypothetical protein N9Z70_05645 [Mariniblastus sp.]|nr:hypothetical protein [Mariniblastus sp.]